MAQRVQVLLVDDVDGGVADQTVSFGLDGSNYEIDLSGANAEALRNAFAPFVAAARRSGRPSGRDRSGATGPRPAPRSTPTDNPAIREWANANGHPVSGRGRISKQVRDAYAAATG